MAKILVGNDHGGYCLKRIIVEHLHSRGLDVEDVGSHSEEIVRYPLYAAQVAAAISQGRAERGILLCSTGIGMSIVANRYPGVRAALCTDAYMARMTREHNDANILCLGGKISDESAALSMMDIWLSTAFIGGRHNISLGLIKELEVEMKPGGLWLPDTNETISKESSETISKESSPTGCSRPI